DPSVVAGKKGIHEPKFNVFDVVSVKINLRGDGAGDAAKVLPRVWQKALLGKVGVEIIHAPFVGEISHLKQGFRQDDVFPGTALEDFLGKHPSYIMVSPVFCAYIIRDRTGFAIKHIVNTVPGQVPTAVGFAQSILSLKTQVKPIIFDRRSICQYSVL